MERPRKVGAKYSGSNICPDEFQQPDLSISYDGKRDRWSGYDPAEHRTIVEEYQKIEEAKRQLRAEKLNSDLNSNSDNEEKDEDKYVDEVDMPGTKVDSKQRITVRNLRIREDTAKYLRNLDPNSAYYDPKTRSMRDNPDPKAKDDEDYCGENFVRFTGDTGKHAQAQLFAWEAYERGVDVHLLAEPTKLELLKKEYEKKKDQFKSQVQDSILDKYGGEEHLDVPSKSLLLAQTENYIEYSRYGKVIKGQEKEIVRSKYEEDIFTNNHTSIWGSYWIGGQWGYKCCCSLIKGSYCLGELGKKSNESVPVIRLDKPTNDTITNTSDDIFSESNIKANVDSSNDSSSSSSEVEKKKESKKKKKKKKKKKNKDKLQVALKEEERKQKEAEELLQMDERKRPYNSMFEAKKPTEEEMEAYYMKRRREEDPMNQFM